MGTEEYVSQQKEAATTQLVVIVPGGKVEPVCPCHRMFKGSPNSPFASETSQFLNVGNHQILLSILYTSLLMVRYYKANKLYLRATFIISQHLVSMPCPSPRVCTPAIVQELRICPKSLLHFSQDGVYSKQSIKKRNKVRLADKC